MDITARTWRNKSVTSVYRKLTHLRHFSTMDFPRVRCYL
jgi:hypothetical protein